MVNRFNELNATNANQAAQYNAGAQNSAGQYNAGAQNQVDLANQAALNQGHQFSATQAQNEAQSQRDFAQQNYQTQAGIYGGQNLAGSTVASANAAGKKSGTSFVCSELRRRGLMSLRESKEMTDFMLRGLPQRADFFAWYFKGGEHLLGVARQFIASNEWRAIKNETVDAVLVLIHRGKELEAQNAYIQAIARLNVQLGLPMGPMKESIRRPGLLKSLAALPLVFAMKSTWRWARDHYGEKTSRRMKKHLRKVA